MPDYPPRIRVHSLDHAHAALSAARDAGLPVILESPQGAAGWQGVGWWRELLRTARSEFADVAFDAVLDCGDMAGYAIAALRVGILTLRLQGPEKAVAAVADIAGRMGGKVETSSPAFVLDLLNETDPRQCCGDRLSSWSSFYPPPLPDGG